MKPAPQDFVDTCPVPIPTRPLPLGAAPPGQHVPSFKEFLVALLDALTANSSVKR